VRPELTAKLAEYLNKENRMATALFIDSFSRNMEVSTVSITEVPGKGLVMRYGAKVGNLWQLTAEQEVFKPEMLILVAARGYAAQSSDGFVDVVVNNRGWNTRVQAQIVGIQGMPWQKKGGLSVASHPMEVLVLRSGTNIMKVATHSSGRRGHSNPATAEAAIVGLKMRAKSEQNSVFILEGQSDYTQAWKLAAYYTAYEEEWTPEFPVEHRLDRFSDEAMALAYIRNLDASRQVFALALGTVAAQVAEKDSWHWVQDFVRPYTGLEWNQWNTFQTGAENALKALLSEGYSLRVAPQNSRTSIEVTLPDGAKETHILELGSEVINSHYVVENCLLDLSSNTDEEKVQIRYNRRADLLRKSLTRTLRENAEDYEVRAFNLLQTGVSYRLVLASWTHYQSSDDWTYGEVRGLEPLVSGTMQEIFDNPLFADYANKANTIFLVSYDENGKAQAAEHVEWGFNFDFGWQGIHSHSAMLNALSIKS